MTKIEQASKYFLREIILKREEVPSFDEYPFSLSVIRDFNSLKFHPAVTYIVGENGMGKSTLLEAIAVAWGFNAEGGSKSFDFSTYNSHSKLERYLKLIKGLNKLKDGYFLRAESFYNVATQIDNLDKEPGGPPIKSYYGGKSLHEQSHGESFFSLFLHRLHGNGLYILDEPEAALSPMRQMAIVARIHELVQQNSQFIIATHSPIIMAYPNSVLYELSKDGITKKHYTETEHYSITKAFINGYEKMIKELLKE